MYIFPLFKHKEWIYAECDYTIKITLCINFSRTRALYKGNCMETNHIYDNRWRDENVLYEFVERSFTLITSLAKHIQMYRCRCTETAHRTPCEKRRNVAKIFPFAYIEFICSLSAHRSSQCYLCYLYSAMDNENAHEIVNGANEESLSHLERLAARNCRYYSCRIFRDFVDWKLYLSKLLSNHTIARTFYS